MTDGVSDPKFHTDIQLNSFEAWEKFWFELHMPLQSQKPEKSLEEWLDFFSKGEHDDRTLAMFVPQSVWQGIAHSALHKEYLVENSPVSDEMNLQSDKKEQGTNENIRTINITQNNETKTISLHKISDEQIQKELNNE